MSENRASGSLDNGRSSASQSDGGRKSGQSSRSSKKVEAKDEFAGTENEGWGENNLQKKLLLMEDEKDNLNFDDLEEMGGALVQFFSKDLPVYTKAAFEGFKRGITPGFIVRMQNKKIHMKEANDKEDAISKLNELVVKTIDDEKEKKKADRAREKIVKELIAARKHIRDAARNVVNEENERLIAEQRLDYERRRMLQVSQNEEEGLKIEWV